jgi:hypothetical protein
VKPNADPTKRPTITAVRRWNHDDDLYLQASTTSAQKDYLLIQNETDFTRGIATAWSNSFKGQGKTTRNKLQRGYEEELRMFEEDPAQDPRPELPVYYYFKQQPH